MLEILILENAADRLEVFKSFQPVESTWVVSDLKAKFELQQKLLEGRPGIEDETILRASELWSRLFKRVRPTMRLLSRDLTLILIREELALRGRSENGAAEAVCDLFETLPHLLVQENAGDLMEEWFEQNPTSKQRWGSWYELAMSIHEKMRSLNELPLTSLTAELLEANESAQYWNRSLTVDVGIELSGLEAQLLLEISKVHTVKVLIPDLDQMKVAPHLRHPFDLLIEASAKRSRVNASSEKPAVIRVAKFASQLAEIKNAVAQVRAWAEEGIPLSQIGIFAPQIENEWPILEPLLREEGLGVQKDRVVTLQSFPEILEWVSRLRLGLEDVQYADLEIAEYASRDTVVESSTKNSAQKFEKFQARFFTLLERKDLGRMESMAKKYETVHSGQSLLQRTDFLIWAEDYFPAQGNFELLDVILREFLQQTDSHRKLSRRAWLQLMEQLIARKEIRVQYGDAKGLQLGNLSSADGLFLLRKIFLGLTEGNLARGGRRLVTVSEAEKLLIDLGEWIPHPEQNGREFDVQWGAEQRGSFSLLCFSMNSLEGQTQAPLRYWLQTALALGQEKVPTELPKLTAWDSRLQLGPEELLVQGLGFDPDRANQVLQQMRFEMGDLETINHFPPKEHRLGVSRLEDYLSCPFIFAAKSYLALGDENFLDIEPPATEQGTFVHALFHRLTEPRRNLNFTETEILEVIEGLKSELGLSFDEQALWLSQKRRFANLAERFLTAENEWRKAFPQTEIVGRELQFEIDVSDPKHWKKASKESTAALVGRIDRVDRDQEGLGVVLDYKRTSTLHASKSAMKHNELQLLFYATAVHEKIISLDSVNEVVGAFYYLYSSFVRKNGFAIKEKIESLAPAKAGISSSDWDSLRAELKSKVNETVAKITAGEFPARPFDDQQCETCHWRKQCRAPHLQ